MCARVLRASTPQEKLRRMAEAIETATPAARVRETQQTIETATTVRACETQRNEN